MDSRWANFVATAVRFSDDESHIASIEVWEDDGQSLTNPATQTRPELITRLESGYTVCTATKGNDGRWSRGPMVKIVVIEGQKYLKTKADPIKDDHLEHLPQL